MNNLSKEAKYCIQKLIDNENLERKEWQLILSLANDPAFSHYFAKQQAIHDSIIGSTVSQDMIHFYAGLSESLSTQPSLPDKSDSFDEPVIRAVKPAKSMPNQKKGA